MRIKGSVSLFMAMIFLMVISVITTTISSARAQGAKIKVSTSVSASVDSVFAKYDSELFKEFGVLLFDGAYGSNDVSKEKIAADIYEYIKEDLSNNGGMDLYQINIKGINISQVETATSRGGLLWMDEAVDYEKYAKAINLASDLLGISDVEDKTTQIGEVVNCMVSVTESVSFVNDKVKDLTKSIDGIEIKDNYISDDFTGYYLKMLDNPIDKLQQAKKFLQNNRNQEYEKIIKSLKKKADAIINLSDNLEITFKILDLNFNTVKDSSEMMINKVEDLKDIFGEEMVNGFCEDFNEMKNYKSVVAKKICDVDKIKKTMVKNKQILIEANSKIQQIKSPDDMDEIINLFHEYSIDEYQIDYSSLIKEKSKSSFLKNISKLFQSEILGLVIPNGDKLSFKKINQKELPSEIIKKDKTDFSKALDTKTKATKKLIYGEYIMDNFNSYTDKKSGKALDYEVEYILNGCSSDIENLYYTVKKLALIRSAVNMACIMSDVDKKDKAEEMAYLALGWTQIEPLIKGTKYLILYGWAYSESLTEVKALLSGWKVNLLKNKELWQCEFQDFITLNFNPDEEKCKKGFKYEIFLRALLMFKNLQFLASNTMDIAELWMNLEGRTDFHMKNQVYAIKGEIMYTVGKINKVYTYSFGQTY